MVAGVRRVGVEIGLVREGLELLRRQSFQSPLLQSLMQTPESVRALRRLERYLRLLEERNKDFFYMPGLLLLAGTQCAMAIEAWRRLHGKDLEHWLSAWAEFEALNALGCYAHERPEDSFPVFEDAAVFDAVALGHPLLPGRACVRNDVRLDARRRFLLISGSNMAGKSTLLRSIGISAVLAYCGAPVAAGRLRLSVFSLAASISAVDSLEDGKSRFLVEVERLRRAIELAESRPPLLFLIDEIFSGTSSLDRRAAAEAVMRRLVGSGAVGAMTTHDLTLTAIAGLPGLHGENVHMGCREGAAHPLDFDYRLKRGVTTERNALAIARMAGVVD